MKRILLSIAALLLAPLAYASTVIPFNGQTLQVSITSVTNGQCLVYSSSQGAWINSSSCGSGGSTTPAGSNFATQYNNSSAFGGVGPGTAGQVLTSNGASAAPSYQSLTASGTVNAGTTPQLAYYASSSAAVSGAADTAINGGALTLGLASSVQGSLILEGSSSGAVTLKPGAAAAGTFNFNLPVTAGSSGNVLVSGGGGSSAMTWDTTSGSGTVLALTNSPSFTTPTLGAATATTINGNTFTTGTYTLTGSAGKTLDFTNTLTLSGTDGTTMTFPGTSQTIAGLSTAQTWSAVQTFTNSDIKLLGSSTGATTFTSANAGATNYTLTVPANTGTMAELNLAQTWSAVQTVTNSDLCLLGSSTGCTTLASANSGATNYTLTVPANTGTVAELNLAQSWTAAQTFEASGILLLGSSTGYTTFASANAGATDYTITFPASTGTVLTTGALVTVAQGGTGTASPGLVAGTNITINGTWPNQTVNATSGGSGTVTVTGSPASPEMTCFSGASSITNCNLSGDVTTSNTSATTLVSIGGTALATYWTNLFASPPALGGTSAAAVNATYLNLTAGDSTIPSNAGWYSPTTNWLCWGSDGIGGDCYDPNGNAVALEGQQSPTGYTNGFLYLISLSGVPTATPAHTSGTGGTVGYNNPPIISDGADYRLYMYGGGAWHNIADDMTNGTALTLSVTGSSIPSGSYGISECVSGVLCMDANGAYVAGFDSSLNDVMEGGEISNSATNGFIYFPSTAGTPTGTPAKISGGGYGVPPCVVDVGAMAMECYSSGWTNLANSVTAIDGYSVTLGGTFSTASTFSTAGAFSTSGAYGLTLTLTALTNATLPPGTVSLGYLGFPETGGANKTSSYTFVLADASTEAIFNCSGACTLTIPANSSVAYPVGTILGAEVLCSGTNAITVQVTTDTLYWSPSGTTGARTVSICGDVIIKKETSTSWKLEGNGVTYVAPETEAIWGDSRDYLKDTDPRDDMREAA